MPCLMVNSGLCFELEEIREVKAAKKGRAADPDLKALVKSLSNLMKAHCELR